MSILVRLPDAELASAVGPLPGVEFVIGAAALTRADDVEVYVADYATGVEAIAEVGRFPKLRLVQLQSAGYDGFLERLPDGVALANATGVHDDATAEHALGLTLAALRGIGESVRQHGVWNRMPGRRSLADSRVLIYGYGSIGRAVADRFAACKAQLTAIASRPRPDDLLGQVHGPDRLASLLPEQHVVVVVLPLTEATHHAVDADFLARLSDDTLVVNVGRGPLLDTDAVLAEAGRLRFALDVTDPEPLPEGHPLWAAPGVLITPHVAGGTTAMLPRVASLVRAQLQAVVAGERPGNLVGQPQ